MAMKIHKLLQPKTKKPEIEILLPILINYCNNITGFEKVRTEYFFKYKTSLREDLKNTIPAEKLMLITPIL